MMMADTLLPAMRSLALDKCVDFIQQAQVAVTKMTSSPRISVSTPNVTVSNVNTNADTYTPELLKKTYQAHKLYVENLLSIRAETNVKVRLPNMPEHISENIVKFIIHHHAGDKTSSWNCKKGDLYSQVEKQQECKTFTSDGPPSFGPNEEWDVIYFLDARKWLEDRYVLYRVGLSNRSDEWRNIKVNKQQTFADQCQQNRRPRITWDALYPQIASHCTKVFEGSFTSIFSPPSPPTSVL